MYRIMAKNVCVVGVANPCEVDFKSSLTVGKIHKNDIGGLWTSSAYENLREKHRET